MNAEFSKLKMLGLRGYVFGDRLLEGCNIVSCLGNGTERHKECGTSEKEASLVVVLMKRLLVGGCTFELPSVEA